jgi:PAS domain S-box-containing protein
MKPDTNRSMEEGNKEKTDHRIGHEHVETEQPSPKLLLNAIPQQVWTANASGQIDYVNEIICRDFGLDAETILNYSWTAFVHPDDLPDSIALWKASVESGHEYTTEFRLLFTDGNYYWHLAIARIVKQKGKPDIWVGTNTNIHSQKINEAKKDEFISIASHELKTPLTTIKGFVQILLRIVEQGKIKNYLERSASQLARLEKLIGDLLDVSKINAGRMVLNPEPFDFSVMLEEVIAEMGQIFPSHRLLLKNKHDIIITGDQYRLEQVINNFISNAVKYSPGSDKVEIDYQIVDENLIVSVTDYGIGIEQKHLKRLFDRYYRADNSAARFDGLGLGLYISADIIKRHGGSFWIESTLGQGSVFSFKLPLNQHTPVKADIKTSNYYKDRHLTISCPMGSDIMHVDWTGYQDIHSVKHGGFLMIEYLKKNKCSKVFNDNRLVPGTWSEASDWAANIWLPLMELAGLQFFAWVLSESAFSQLSAMKSVENEKKQAEILFFTDASEAMQWLEGSVI